MILHGNDLGCAELGRHREREGAPGDCDHPGDAGGELLLAPLGGNLGGQSDGERGHLLGCPVGQYLGVDCFLGNEAKQPTPYDSPAKFAPAALSQRVQPVLEALKQLENTLATATNNP